MNLTPNPIGRPIKTVMNTAIIKYRTYDIINVNPVSKNSDIALNIGFLYI